MEKKIISLNLWYEKYGNKTNAQLKSFRKLGYDTHVATIVSSGSSIRLNVFELFDSDSKPIFSLGFSNYSSAFEYLFNYCIEQKYEFIYIRRLMSKLLSASKYFKMLSKSIPIVYEIPTYPLDTGNSILFKIRDFIEMSRYKSVNKYVALTLVNLIDDSVSLPNNWQIFHNALDIDNYHETAYPELSDTIKFIIIANISEYHHYERMLYAMNLYSGKYSIELAIISPESNSCNNLKSLANTLNLNTKITFYDSLPLRDIQNIAKDYHIGIAQLSTSEKGSNLVNTLKSKDYCAMGLPFVSTCYDTSFEKDFPYAYVTQNMDDDINLDEIIDWYMSIRRNINYRSDMYNYAKNNLQYDKFAQQIIDRLGLN